MAKPVNGESAFTATDIQLLWMTDSAATQQDLNDACEEAGARRGEPSELGNTRWVFDDGSSIELTWNEAGIYVRGSDGRYILEKPE
jgi:hypothetical protein